MKTNPLFQAIEDANSRPAPFEFYTAQDLWTDEHTSAMMLQYHLNGDVDVSSRNSAFIERSIGWILNRFKVAADSAIADFGCGPGLYTSKLAAVSNHVTGVDFSPRSIAYAKDFAEKNKLNINYENANYLQYSTEKRFDLITMIMCDFCALSPEQRKQMLSRFHSLLKPSGCLLLDVYSLNAFASVVENTSFGKNTLGGFWSDKDYYCFSKTCKYDTEKVSLDKYTIVESLKTKVVYNWLQYFNLGSLRREFEENGFELIEVYGDVAGSPFDESANEYAVIAMKTCCECE